MSLSRDQIVQRASQELAGAASAWSRGPLAEAARERAALPQPESGSADVALVDVTRLSARGLADVPAPGPARRTVALTLAFDACTVAAEHGAAVDRLIGPFGVVDVTSEGLVIVEVALGVSGRDLQERSSAPLLAGPDLGPVRLDASRRGPKGTLGSS